MIKISQSQFDRAREWVNENRPDAEGAEYEDLLKQVALEIAEIDEQCDEDELPRPR